MASSFKNLTFYSPKLTAADFPLSEHLIISVRFGLSFSTLIASLKDDFYT